MAKAILAPGLQHLLKPPGAGIPVISTSSEDSERIGALWAKALGEPNSLAWWKYAQNKMATAKVAILGVPSDTGAGIRRGAALGPVALREAMYHDAGITGALKRGELIDIGDVFCNPHLLLDSMLSREQIKRSQVAQYPKAPLRLRRTLPVSPLSATSYVVRGLRASNPGLKLLVLGGDHSVAWPVVEHLLKEPGTGIVQFDAHTDLLASRFGVEICFGSWSFHALKLLKKNSARFVQLGIRQSGQERGFWEAKHGLKQLWSQEIRARPQAESVAGIIAHLHRQKVKRVYISNDIDGTDPAFASATGTPSEGGLVPQWVEAVIRTLGQEFEVIGADLVEVAPDLGRTPVERSTTISTGLSYISASLEAMGVDLTLGFR